MQYYETAVGQDLDLAKKLLTDNELVAIPTETVYGLAANALSETAVQKIFDVKGRPLYNPLIVHVGSIDQVYTIAEHVPEAAKKLLARFAPGPLTVLLPKKQFIPGIVTAGLPTVAIRIPSSPVTLELLNAIDFPLAAPSANPFGYISPTKASHVKHMLDGKIPYILDGGDSNMGIESTIIGFANHQPVIYRQGIITKEEIEEFLGTATRYGGGKIVSPGMLDRHYAPSTPLYLTEDIGSIITELGVHKTGLVTYNAFSSVLPHDQQILLYTSDNVKRGARRLYSALHELDSRGYRYIVVRKLPDHGIGAAINDRLTRASRNSKKQ